MAGVRLSREERDEISVGLARGDSFRGIARILERNVSTVSREVARNGGREGYRPFRAQHRAEGLARRPRLRLLEADPDLALKVGKLLDQKWSPAPIAAHLKSLGLGVCHETIYIELYRPDSVLGDRYKNLCRPRPSRRRRRRTTRGTDTRPLGDIRLITSLDPQERTPVDYWEGDLLCGSRSLSACVVLTHRASRLTLIGALRSQTKEEVCDKVCRMLRTVPETLRRLLVWDQGRELADWTRIETKTGINVVFCEPRSPWQKPLVENTCGHLRRWLPRNRNLYLPQHTLTRITNQLNNMPRRSLNWHTPHQAYTATVAMTD